MKSPLLYQFSQQYSITMQQTMYSRHNVSGKGIIFPGHSASKYVASVMTTAVFSVRKLRYQTLSVQFLKLQEYRFLIVKT